MRKAIAVLVALSAISGLTGTAQAATSYAPTGSFAKDVFFEPSRIAVDEGTGDVFVVVSGESVVRYYEPSGGSYVEAGAISGLSSPFGVAVDQATGALYVADTYGNRIVKYTSDGATPPTYSEDGAFTSPAPGSEAGQIGNFSSPIAVDPTNGDLLVADTGNQRVSRYESDGTFVSSFTGSDATEGAFHSLQDIGTADDGSVYVIDATTFNPPSFGGPAVVEHFSAAGAFLAEVGPVPTPRALAFDASSGNLVVAGDSEVDFVGGTTHQKLYVFDGGTQVDAVPVPPESSGAVSAVRGLAANGETGRLFALKGVEFGVGNSGVEFFDPITVPGVSLDAPSGVTATAAHLSGNVDPDGLPTTYRFEYSADGGATWTATETGDAGSGEGAVPVSADLTGLQPNTEYRARLWASNGSAAVTTAARAFTTEVAPPGLAVQPPTDRTATEITLRGSVNPFGLASTYYFEYGTTAAYGSRAPADFDAPAGAGTKALHVKQALSALQPGTTYHYRLVAANSAGSAATTDATFTTKAAGVPGRAYEMVSPVDKGGADVRAAPNGFQARVDGDSVVYTAQSALLGSESSPLDPRYLGRRGAGGWSMTPLDPPQNGPKEFGHIFFPTMAVSEDQSHALVASKRKLTPDAVEGNGNVYVKDLSDGSYQLVATSEDPFFFATMVDAGSQNNNFIAGTPDFSSIVFANSAKLTPDASAPMNLYQWSEEGGLELASVLPDGTPDDGFAGTAEWSQRAQHQMSTDGQRFYWSTENGSHQGLYLNEGGQSVAVSVSQVENAPQTPHPARFDGATADGRFMVFTVVFDTTPLTDDAPETANDTYLYDAETGDLEYLTSRVENILQVSDDMQTVYFKSFVPLTPEATFQGIYAFRDGEVQFVGSGESTDMWSASPNGRYFAFQSRSKQTSFDPAGTAQVYLYDADEETLVCPSCRTDGGAPSGAATIGSESRTYLSRHFSRAVTDDGRLFFDTPAPLAARDVNSSQDVYEWSEGEPVLVSRGTKATSSYFEDATPNGSDVFFVTNDRLVGQDVDELNDLYDARVGGGIAAQNPPPPRGECGGGDCPAAAPPPPPAPEGASESLTGPGNVKRHPHRHRACRGRGGKAKTKSAHRAKGRCGKRGAKHGRGGAR